MAKLQSVLHHEIISVALLRIHGTKVAEVPFAGTLLAYQKQGVTLHVVSAIEQVLVSLKWRSR